MTSPPNKEFSPRDFLAAASALGSASLLRLPSIAASEPPPETPRIRILEAPLTCIAPQIVVRELLHAEGFTDVRYVKYLRDTQHWPPEDLLAGEVDITVSFPPMDLRFLNELKKELKA